MMELKDLTHEQLLLVAQEMQVRIASLEQTNDCYANQIRLMHTKMFKRRSEKIPAEQLDILKQLFNEAEVIADENKDEDIPDDLEIKPKKKSGKNKKHIRYGLVEKETVKEYFLSDEKLKCSKCGGEMRLIATQSVRTELVYHRAYFERVVYKQGVYECVNKCEPEGDGPHGESLIVKADIPTPLLPKSSASPSLMAYIIHGKFEKSLPLYRQEVEFDTMGINLTRQTMSNWIVRLYNMYLQRIIEHMKRELKKSHVMLLDETRVEVLKHPNSKPSPSNSYVWVARTGPFEPKSIVIFEYKLGRDHKYALEMVEDYHEIIVTDGYEAYDKLDNVHIGCWQHAKRKFTDTLEALDSSVKKEDTQAFKLAGMISRMQSIENGIKDKSIEKRLEVRQKRTKKIVDEFFKIVQQNYELLDVVPGNDNFKKAIRYAHNQEKKLRLVLEYGEVDITTNQIENTIRNFAVGRRNWLFFNTVSGATAGCALYSIIVTAKQNGLMPYHYLEYLFDNIRNIQMDDEAELEKLMPWSPTIPKNIKKAKKA